MAAVDTKFNVSFTSQPQQTVLYNKNAFDIGLSKISVVFPFSRAAAAAATVRRNGDNAIFIFQLISMTIVIENQPN